jgi:hypothetical protein
LNDNDAEFFGGAISNSGTLALTSCTLSGNFANRGGAALHNTNMLTLVQCTLSGNFSSSEAILNFGALTLINSIVAGNLGNQGVITDIYAGGGTVSSGGVNILGNNDTVSSVFPAGPLVGTPGSPLDPRLAPLADYGGRTQTMALLPGSPARDAAAVLVPATIVDQRGFPIVNTPDIGAYEAGTLSNFNAWRWETAGSALAFQADEEGDGAINGLEYALRRDPLASDAPASPTVAPDGSGNVFEFRYRAAALDLRYIVQRSPDLALPASGWTEIYRYDSSTGVITELFSVTGDENPTSGLITLTDSAAGPQFFWRLLVEKVGP